MHSAAMRDSEPVRMRTACDRCHGQKLRCTRRAGLDICDRCAKFGTSCVFSPFRDSSSKKPRVDAPVALDCPSAIFGLQRKRTISQAKDGFEDGPSEERPGDSLNQFGPTVSDATGLSWMSNSCLLFQDFEVDYSFADLDFDNLNDGLIRHQMMYHASQASPANLHTEGLAQDTYESLYTSMTSSASIDDHLDRSTNSPAQILEVCTESYCIRQLCELSITLYEHSTTILPRQMNEQRPWPLGRASEGLDLASYDSQDIKPYDFNDTVRLTQSLVDIYPLVMDKFVRDHLIESPGASIGTITSPASAHHRHSNFEDEALVQVQRYMVPSTATTTTHRTNPLDHSSVLLILSCHVRLLDIFDALYDHVLHHNMSQDNNSRLPGNNKSQLNKMPSPAQTLQIDAGVDDDYLASSTSSFTMKMLLLIQMAAQLYEYAAELALRFQGERDLFLDGSSRGEQATLSQITAETVKDRASNMSLQVGSLKNLVLQIESR